MTDMIALYEIQRTQLILGYYGFPELIDPALVFAYESRIYPYFHEYHLPAPKNLYEGCYAVEKEFIRTVFQYLHDIWKSNNSALPTFYDLESKFGGFRESLADTLRYMFLSKSLTPDVFLAIESNCPSEVGRLTHPFSREEAYI